MKQRMFWLNFMHPGKNACSLLIKKKKKKCMFIFYFFLFCYYDILDWTLEHWDAALFFRAID